MEKKKMGRPTKPEYRKKRYRFGTIEDMFLELSESMNKNEREVAEKLLNELKARVI